LQGRAVLPLSKDLEKAPLVGAFFFVRARLFLTNRRRGRRRLPEIRRAWSLPSGCASSILIQRSIIRIATGN